MKVIYIYALICPVSGGVRYIGKSIRPKERLSNHMNEVSNCHRSHWIQGLKSSGLKPSMEILEEISDSRDWRDVERRWISLGLMLGWKLTNNTSGGDGVSGLPPETRERMRQTWIGRKHKPESIIKIGQASKGRKHTEEHKKEMSELMKKRDITWGDKIAESIRKLSEHDQLVIRDRLASGERVKDLAAEYGVHRTTLSKVKSGTYKVK